MSWTSASVGFCPALLMAACSSCKKEQPIQLERALTPHNIHPFSIYTRTVHSTGMGPPGARTGTPAALPPLHLYSPRQKVIVGEARVIGSAFQPLPPPNKTQGRKLMYPPSYYFFCLTSFICWRRLHSSVLFLSDRINCWKKRRKREEINRNFFVVGRKKGPFYPHTTRTYVLQKSPLFSIIEKGEGSNNPFEMAPLPLSGRD